MGLETGNYINDLVTTNPTATDPKSAGDDQLRLIKAVLKETLNGFTGAILLTATETGTASAHVLTPTTALVGYTVGLCLLYRPSNAGTGALSVNVSGLGAKSVKTIMGADPTSGDITANQPILLFYDGTNFVLLCGSEYLSKTGNQTLTGNLTLTGNQTVSGTLSSAGATTLPAATTVGSTTATEFTYLQGVTSAIQTQINTKSPTASPTFTGTPAAPTAAPGTNTTQLATTAFVLAQAFNSALPNQAGNSGKYVTSDGLTASWAVVAQPSVIRSARTSNTILSAADNQTLIDITSGTFSQTFTAAATLGNGWFCYIRNSGTGDITLDPNGSETIDGLTSFVMYTDEVRLAQCTGTGFTTIILNPFYRNITSTLSFITPPGYSKLGCELWGGGGGGGGGEGQAAGIVRSGGGGGGGGGKNFGQITSPAAGTTITATIGAGGISGTGGSTYYGVAGGTGGTTSFGTYLLAYGGGGGDGDGSQLGVAMGIGGGGGGSQGAGAGQGAGASGINGGAPNLATWDGATIRLFGTSALLAPNCGFGGGGGGDGGASDTIRFIGCTEYGGSGGGTGANAATASVGLGAAKSSSGATGGGGGGSISTGNTGYSGGAGGTVGWASRGGGAAAGTGSAGNGGTAGSLLANQNGGGGGGGAPHTAGTGGAGGAGATPGGGGGGGGGGTSVGGAGGIGGTGTINVWGIA